MQDKNQQLKENEGTQHKIPLLLENETIMQLKVRTDIRSGGCPPCQYPKTCFCDLSGNNCWCDYGKVG